MANAVLSDVSGKVYASNRTYRMSLFNRSNSTHLDIDISWQEMQENTPEQIIKMALQDKSEVAGQQWYKIQKNQEGKWERQYLSNTPSQDTTGS